jgi:hypothetical protein
VRVREKIPRVREKMSRLNYDAQEADKDFNKNTHHVPLRKIVPELRPKILK